MFLLADSFVIDTQIKIFISVFCILMIIYKRTHTDTHPPRIESPVILLGKQTHTQLRPELGPKIMFHADRFTSKWGYEIKSPRPKCYWHSGFMIITQPSDSSYFFPSSYYLKLHQPTSLNPKGLSLTLWQEARWSELTQRGGKNTAETSNSFWDQFCYRIYFTIQCFQACLKQRDVDIKIS